MSILWIYRKNLQLIFWFLLLFSLFGALEVILMLIGYHNDPASLQWIYEHILPSFLIDICLYPALAFGIRAGNRWVSAILPYFMYQTWGSILITFSDTRTPYMEGWLKILEIGGWVKITLFFLICLNTMFYITGLIQRYIKPRIRAIFRKKHAETGVNGSMIILWIYRKNLWLISWFLLLFSVFLALEVILMLVGYRNHMGTLLWINEELLPYVLIDICLYTALAFGIRAGNTWVSAILPYFMYQNLGVLSIFSGSHTIEVEGWFWILSIGGRVKVVLFFLIYINTMLYIAGLLQPYIKPRIQAIFRKKQAEDLKSPG